MPSPTAAHNACIRFKSRHKRLALALALLPCAFTHAESADLFNLSIEELMDVKVSVASLTEESMREAPASVSKLTRDDWTRNGSRRLTDALESVPNVVSHEIWGGTETISIRGYSTELSGVRGLASSLDGVPLNSYTHATSAYHLPNLALDSLQQVEMIRGPGSTLYGTDAFHGVVAMSTRSSENDMTEVDAEVGHPTWAEGSFFTSSHDNNLQSNIGFNYQKQGEQNIGYEYTDPDDGSVQHGERDNVFRNVTGYGSWIWGDKSNVGEWKFSTFLNDYQAQRFAGLGTQFFHRIPESFNVASRNLSQDRDLTDQDSRFMMGQLQYQVDLNDQVSLENRVYHWNSSFNWRYDNSRYPLSMIHRGRTTPTVIPPNTVLPCRTSENPAGTTSVYCPHALRQYYDENRTGVQSNLHLKDLLPSTSLVTGIGWDHQKILKSYYERVTAAGDYLVRGEQGYEGKNREISYAFFQGKTAWFDDALALHYGARHDDYSGGDSHTSPRAGLVWQVHENWTSKWLYGQAYRAPNASEMYPTAGAALAANAAIKPETIDTFEWVNIYHADSMQHELVVFKSRWKDGIVLEPIAAGSTTNIYRNTGDNESKGVELSSVWFNPSWRLGGSLSFTDSTNKTADQDYVAFPKWLSTLEATYLMPEYALELSLKERILLDYADTDQIANSDYPRDNNYYRTDISVSKKLQTHEDAPEVFAHLYNIFDRENRLPGLYNAEGGIPDDGFRVVLGTRWQW